MKRDMGLARHGHWLGYGLDHGFGMWLPYLIQRMITKAWNVVSCSLLGHDTLTQDQQEDPVYCVSCMRRVTDPGQGVLRIWELDL